MIKKSTFTRVLSFLIAAFVCTAPFSVSFSAAETKDVPIGSYYLEKPAYTDEYKQYLQANASGAPAPQMYQSTNTVLQTARAQLPASYNAKNEGFVTPVKNQGSLNTCWVFGAMSGLETWLLKNGLGSYDFSEEHANHWATTRANGTGWQRDYTDGGYSQMMPGYFTSWSGPRPEKDIPYRSADHTPFEQIDQKGSTSIGVTDLMFLGSDRNTLKQAVYTYGSVTAGCSTRREYFNASATAFYCPADFSAGENTGGHVVSVIGWDDAYPKENFNSRYRPQSNGAWLVKNSWGAQNNVEGYYWISYEDKYIFNKRYGKNYAIVQAQPIDGTQRLYQNEIYGATYDLTVYEKNGSQKNYLDHITYVNTYDFTDGYTMIERIIFESECMGAAYTIHYIPFADGAPTTDRASWKLLASGAVPYSGYISVETPGFTAPEGAGAVGVTIDASAIQANASLGVGEWLENTTANKMTFLPDVQKGGCYLLVNGEMLELTQAYRKFFDNDEIGGMLVIKAVTSKTNPRGDINGDGFLSISDVLLMQKHLAKLLLLDQTVIKDFADLNGDRLLTIEDVLALQNIIAKKI